MKVEIKRVSNGYVVYFYKTPGLLDNEMVFATIESALTKINEWFAEGSDGRL